MIAQAVRPSTPLATTRVLLAVQTAALALPGVPALVMGFSTAADPMSAQLLKLSLIAGLILTGLALAGTALTIALPRTRDAQYLALVYEIVLAVASAFPAVAALALPALHLFTLILALAIIITIHLIRHLRTTPTAMMVR